MKETKQSKYTIHTICILRNEIKNYEGICEEKKKVISVFQDTISRMEERIHEIDDCLVSIKK